MDNTVGSLTQRQKSIIIGTVLGDGYLRKMKGRKNAFMEINHSFNQKKYVDWKYNELLPLSAGKPKSRKGEGSRIAYRFSTKQHPFLSKLLRKFYRGNKKIIPDDLELNSLIISVWYMDDGGRCGKHDFYFNTQQFSVKDQNRLVTKLSKMGLESRLNRDKEYYRIRLLKKSIPNLKRFIRKYILPSLEYKIE